MRRAIMIVLGAIPATLQMPFAWAGLIYGVIMLAQGIAWGLLLFCWSGAGVIGTIALWTSLLGTYRRWTFYGLVAGVLAAAPLTLLAIKAYGSSPSIHWMEALMLVCSITVPMVGALEILRERRVPRAPA